MKIERNLRKKLLGEAAIYGLLSVIYGSLFFFGALYPRYGLSAACVEESTEDEEVVYKSFFLECLKEWF